MDDIEVYELASDSQGVFAASLDAHIDMLPLTQDRSDRNWFLH